MIYEDFAGYLNQVMWVGEMNPALVARYGTAK
jgi:hypothetical protein